MASNIWSYCWDLWRPIHAHGPAIKQLTRLTLYKDRIMVHQSCHHHQCPVPTMLCPLPKFPFHILVHLGPNSHINYTSSYLSLLHAYVWGCINKTLVKYERIFSTHEVDKKLGWVDSTGSYLGWFFGFNLVWMSLGWNQGDRPGLMVFRLGQVS